MSIAIVWFRRDLRLTDQPALQAALARYAQVVPVYIHAPDEEDEWAPGGAQRWWLHHSLMALGADLEAVGSRLTIRCGPSEDALADLLETTGAEAVFWNRLYEPAVIERDRRIKAWLRERGIEASSSNAALLCEPWQIETGQGNPYRVFTPFYKRLHARGLADSVTAAPTRIPTPPELPPGEDLATLALLPHIRWDTGLAATWQPGEAGAQRRLERFCDELAMAYHEAREYPAQDGTSALSPHLHWGEIGPRQAVRALHQRGLDAASGGSTFLSELAWREFAHHLLYHFPHTPVRPLNERFEAFPWRDAQGAAAGELRAWQTGRTGIPMVDAGMRELWYSGWMHNRIRMVVASFLTKNLRLHWLEGARWFWDTLVDADLASNTLGWQWAGGCGADAAPYFRIFNPVRQGERFDPNGHYVRTWIPEIAGLPDRYIHAPWQAPAKVRAAIGLELGQDYPEPIVDLQASRRAALEAFEQLRSTAP